MEVQKRHAEEVRAEVVVEAEVVEAEYGLGRGQQKESGNQAEGQALA
jgi:hypothetical protein